MLSYCSLINIHRETQSENVPEVIVEERIKAPRDAAAYLREDLKSTHTPLSAVLCSRFPSPAHICSSGLGVLPLLSGHGRWLSNFLPAETAHS